MNEIVDVIFEASDKVQNDRDPQRILAYLMEEVGELATEIAIEAGIKNKEQSTDGVVGESIDVIVCALDIIRRHSPHLTGRDLATIAERKCEKWLANEEALKGKS